MDALDSRRDLSPEKSFAPARRVGVLVGLLSFVGIALFGAWLLAKAGETPLGVQFAQYVIGFFLLLFPGAYVLYRTYALVRSTYTIDPNGVRLEWGLRTEEIPMTDIQLVRKRSDMDERMPIPLMVFPGSFVGERRARGKRWLFLAANLRDMVFLETKTKVFAISPVKPDTFVFELERMMEVGSLSPWRAQSIRPRLLVGQVWDLPILRALLLTNVGLSVAMLVVVGFLLTPVGRFPAPIPTQLILIALLNLTFLLINLFLGLFSFRRVETQPLSYILWGAHLAATLAASIVIFSLVS